MTVSFSKTFIVINFQLRHLLQVFGHAFQTLSVCIHFSLKTSVITLWQRIWRKILTKMPHVLINLLQVDVHKTMLFKNAYSICMKIFDRKKIDKSLYIRTC